MPSIKIAPVKSAGAELLRRATKMDKNKDGTVSAKELFEGRKTAGGEAAVDAIYKLRNSMVGNQWYDAGGPKEVNLVALKRAIDKGVSQLKAIDEYKGNVAAHKAGNTKDGVVTPKEVTNYGPGQGKIQHFAEQVLWYSKNK